MGATWDQVETKCDQVGTKWGQLGTTWKQVGTKSIFWALIGLNSKKLESNENGDGDPDPTGALRYCQDQWSHQAAWRAYALVDVCIGPIWARMCTGDLTRGLILEPH